MAYATKADLEKMGTDLRSEIQNLKYEMNVKFSEINVKFSDVYRAIAETKNELIKWVIGMAFGQTALVFTLIKLFN